jgi:hypothetical protein
MGHSYKGSSAPAGSLTLWAAPVLTDEGDGGGSWSWTSGNPKFWELFHGPTVNGPWSYIRRDGGAVSSDGSFVEGDYNFIQGAGTVLHSFVTQPSNIVLFS